MLHVPRMQYFTNNFPQTKFASRTAVRDILTIPSVVPIKRTNQIDRRVYKNINQSAPEGQVLTLRGNQRFSLSPRRFAARSNSRGEKCREKPLTFPRHMPLNFDKLEVLRRSRGKSELKCTR